MPIGAGLVAAVWLWVVLV